MRRTIHRVVTALVLCTIASTLPPGAGAAIDPNAAIVLLRTDCTGVDDCFTTTAAAVDWIVQTRQPSSTSPLLVDIGPGEFGLLACGGTNLLAFDPSPLAFSHVTFRGAGREHTVIAIDECPVGTLQCGPIMAVGADCHDLAFQDLTARTDGQPTSGVYGVVWRGDAGNSVWTNVDILGTFVGWYEYYLMGCDMNNLTVHYWFNSRVIARQPDGNFGAAYAALCGESWFYGSELRLEAGAATVPGGYADGLGALKVGLGHSGTKGDVRMFGSTVRVVAADVPADVFSQSVEGIVGVGVAAGSIFHKHGGIINVTVNNTNPSAITGLAVMDGGFAHTPGTAFTVSGGLGLEDGRTARVRGTGALSPFLHPPGGDPPRAIASDPSSAFLGSTTGSDLFVETDCDDKGRCESNGTETHLMVSNPTLCGAANPWFNVVKQACRRDP